MVPRDYYIANKHFPVILAVTKMQSFQGKYLKLVDTKIDITL